MITSISILVFLDFNTEDSFNPDCNKCIFQSLFSWILTLEFRRKHIEGLLFQSLFSWILTEAS